MDPSCHPSGEDRPRLEVADVFRSFGDDYRRTHVLTGDQRDVMRAIETCRTGVLGGHLDVCDSCGYERPAYNSCRNRHCPKCQSFAQALWLAKRKERLLPTHYFHVVFTLPADLRPLALRNREAVYEMLFQAASRTLLDLGHDENRLGATLGFTAVLHTWTRALTFHPHLHCIVTGGGLSPGGEEWKDVDGGRGRFLFPVQVMSRLFRGKFLAALAEAHTAQRLDLGGACAPLADEGAFRELEGALYRRDWVVYVKPPFADPEQVYRYLGLYTHRVGISNHRLLDVSAAGVRFKTRDGGILTLEPPEFIRRFLLHVLPKGFVKIRHYGLLASGNVHTKLAQSRALLGEQSTPQVTPAVQGVESPAQTDPRELVLALTGIDLFHCPRCKTGGMVRYLLVPCLATNYPDPRPPPEGNT